MSTVESEWKVTEQLKTCSRCKLGFIGDYTLDPHDAVLCVRCVFALKEK